MPDQREPPPGERPPPPRKKRRYSPFSSIAAPLALPVALVLGKAVGEALEWGKPATITAECVIGAVAALVLAVGINFFFGKEVEVTEKKAP
jgi:hypothetical protein